MVSDGIAEKQILRTPTAKSKPCMKCQYGIFDVPTDGKLNCLEAGTSDIKLFTREEVENMKFCDRMVHWSKMDLNQDEKTEESALKLAEKILGKRYD
jgi:hypothetical protein